MTYTVLLNSKDSNNGTIDNCRFYFDWDVINNEKYKVNIQFISSSLTTPFDKIPSLFIELGQSNTFRANKELIIAETTQFVTPLYKVETKTSPYLISDTNSECIELLHRPINKDFSVRIINDDGSIFTSETTFSYTIKLTFEEDY
jgi:hypothetical protein